MWLGYSGEPAAQRAGLSGRVVWARAPHELSYLRPTANMLLQAATNMHAETIHTRCEEVTCMWVSYSRESMAQRAGLSRWVV